MVDRFCLNPSLKKDQKVYFRAKKRNSSHPALLQGSCSFSDSNIDQKVYFKIIFPPMPVHEPGEIENSSLFRSEFGSLPDYKRREKPVEPEGDFFHTELADIGLIAAF